MLIFIRKGVLSALLCAASSALLTGCGNKGDLYLVTQDELLPQITTIEDALDELEVMESEEEEEL